MLIAILTTALVLPAASLAAFVIARYPFRGREFAYGLFTLGLLFPIAVAILPLFVMLRQVGLLSTPLGVALPQAAFGLPIAIVIMRPFFRAIPKELQDAAALDGCGPLRFYWSIMLPLSRPVLSTVAVLSIVGSWNAFFLPLLVLIDPDQQTLPIGVNNISTQYSTDFALVLAYTTLSMIPALLFYALAERQIIGGLDRRCGQGLSAHELTHDTANCRPPSSNGPSPAMTLTHSDALYLDSTASVDDRVADLLDRMTLDEKLAQLGSVWVFQIAGHDGFDVERATPLIGAGIGHITRMSGASSLGSAAAALLANEVQRFLLETRLGIPAIVHEEICSGLMAREATVFAQAIGVASTFRPEHNRRSPTRSAARCARSVPTRACRRCSTSAVIRAGAGSRRPTAKTRTSCHRWAWRSSAACRATTSSTG